MGSYRIAVSILANVLRGTSGPLVWHYVVDLSFVISGYVIATVYAGRTAPLFSFRGWKWRPQLQGCLRAATEVQGGVR